ncbi:MAG: protein phosphatase 2C domain-containing protein, partial [Acidimicrobiales bacterium]
AGEVASEAAVKSLEEAYGTAPSHSPEDLAQAAHRANRAVWDLAQGDPHLHGMGTTLVALAPVEDGGHQVIAAINVGDSRLYLLRDDELEQLSEDHSLVAELIAEGQITPAEAKVHPQRHVLSRALGVYPDVPVDLLVIEPVSGDRYVLCSDGLSREVNDDQMAAVLRRLADPGEAARELVDEARRRGGSDNITVVVIDALDDDASSEKAAAPPASDPAESPSSTPSGPESTAPWQVNHKHAPRREVVPPPRAAPPDLPREAPKQRRVNPFTFRVALFTIALLTLVGLGIGGTAWYARAGYFVGLNGRHLAIYQGRPGGVLWWNPTLVQRTAVTTSGVEPRHMPSLQAGVTESSLGAARNYVSNLAAEYSDAQAADQPPPPPPTTVVATTVPPVTAPATTVPVPAP